MICAQVLDAAEGERAVAAAGRIARRLVRADVGGALKPVAVRAEHVEVRLRAGVVHPLQVDVVRAGRVVGRRSGERPAVMTVTDGSAALAASYAALSSAT